MELNMKLRVDWARALTWSFLLLTAASGVNFVLGARTYFMFYSALDEVQFTITAASFQQGSSNSSSILIQIIGENPVDYSGLKVTLVAASTYFASSNATLFENAPLYGSGEIDLTLPPHGEISWSLTIQVSDRDTSPLLEFYKAHNSNVTAVVSLTVEMSTFLDKVVGIPTQLPPVQQNITLT